MAFQQLDAADRTSDTNFAALSQGLASDVAALLRDKPGANGLSLIDDNLRAFALRAYTARKAMTSLDLQYYYWRNDLTGQLLLREVLLAADRGARVRILLDDFNTGGRDRIAKVLSIHPNISVRYFNPSRTRESPVRRTIELLFNAWSATRRMHNKAWIADEAIVIAGGRNIGDAYFDACPDTHFVDLDVLAIGPAVSDARAIFDQYWRSKAAVLRKAFAARQRLTRLRRQLDLTYQSERAAPYIQAVERLVAQGDFISSDALTWSKKVRVIADPPEKASGAAQDRWISRVIFEQIGTAGRSLHISSPYFIPGHAGVRALRAMTERGVSVAILTNSLASTDVVAVHGAYAKYRADILKAGITLYELKPSGERERASLFGSSAGKLHTKAFTIDGETAFVGSYNFDPRSQSINTEMGILIEHPDLAARIDKILARETTPRASYALKIDARDRLSWIEGERIVPAYEPDAGFFRKIMAKITGWLPFEAQL